MVILTKHSGVLVEFAPGELAQTLAHLVAGGNTRCQGRDGVVFLSVGGTGLLLVDASWHVGRRLVETYTVAAEAGMPFGISFQLGAATYTLSQALAGAGHVLQEPLTDLAQVHMAHFATTGGALTYLAPSNLVLSEGVFQSAPAQLREVQGDGDLIAATVEGGALKIGPAPGLSQMQATLATAAEDLQFLEGEVADLEAEKQPLLTATAPLSLEGATLSVDLSAYAPQTALDAAQLTADQNAAAVTSLQADVASLQASKASQEDHDALASTVASESAKLDAAAASAASNAANIEVLQAATSSAQTQLGNLSAVVTSESARLDAAAASVAQNASAIAGKASQVDHDALAAVVASESTRLDTTAGQVAGKQDALTAGTGMIFHEPLLEGGTVKSLVAGGGVSLSSSPAFVTVSTTGLATTAALSEGLAGKQDEIAIFSGADPPNHQPLLQNGVLKSLVPGPNVAFSVADEHITIEASGGTDVDFSAVPAPLTIVDADGNQLHRLSSAVSQIGSTLDVLGDVAATGVVYSGGIPTLTDDTGYTRADADALLAGKQPTLSASTAITTSAITAHGEIVCDSLRARSASQFTVRDNLTVEGELTVEGTPLAASLASKEPAFTAVPPLTKTFVQATGQTLLHIDSPFWVAGTVRGTDLAILSSRGRYPFTVARGSLGGTGYIQINWTEPHPDGPNHIDTLVGHGIPGNYAWQVIINYTGGNGDLANSATRLGMILRDAAFTLRNGTFSFTVLA